MLQPTEPHQPGCVIVLQTKVPMQILLERAADINPAASAQLLSKGGKPTCQGGVVMTSLSASPGTPQTTAGLPPDAAAREVLCTL